MSEPSRLACACCPHVCRQAGQDDFGGGAVVWAAILKGQTLGSDKSLYTENNEVDVVKPVSDLVQEVVWIECSILGVALGSPVTRVVLGCYRFSFFKLLGCVIM